MQDSRRAVSTYICDHLPSGLVPLSVVCPLLFLLQDTLSRGAVLKGKLTENLTEAMDANLTHSIGRLAQEKQEGMESGDGENMRSH